MLEEQVDNIDKIKINIKTENLCKNGDIKYMVRYSNIEANPISYDKFYLVSREATQYRSVCS